MEWIKAGMLVLVYLFLYFAFGSLITFRIQDEHASGGMTLIIGFFLYYVIFQIIAAPMMFMVQPLSRLTLVWSILATGIVVFSVWKNHVKWRKVIVRVWCLEKRDTKQIFWSLVICTVVAFNIVIVSSIYSSYWDATYYVGNVSYSVYYNTINTINPLHGTVMDYFDMKHCLAMYHVNDAVFCQLFQVHPLIETKTIMVVVVTVMLNVVYYQFAKFFFLEELWKRAMMMGFCLLVNLCTYTAYTASSFVLLRTYEGKAIAGAIIAPMLFYWFVQMFRQKKEEFFLWQGLFLTSWGAAAISSSALFLVLVSIGCFGSLQCIRTRHWQVLMRSVVCMIPPGMVLVCYLLNRLGVFAIRISR